MAVAQHLFLANAFDALVCALPKSRLPEAWVEPFLRRTPWKTSSIDGMTRETTCASRQHPDDDDELRKHDAQQHDFQISDDIPERLLHGPLLQWVGGVFTSGLAHR